MEKKGFKKYFNKEALNIPNSFTSFRILSSMGLTAWILAIGMTNPWMAPIGFGIAVTDGIDGWLARKTNKVTELGAILDPIADKFLNWGVAAGLFITGVIPLSPLALIPIGAILLRDAGYAITAGYQKKKNDVVMKPTFPAKLKMALQSIGSVSVLAFGFGTLGMAALSPISMGLAGAAAIWDIFEAKKKYFHYNEEGKKEVFEGTIGDKTFIWLKESFKKVLSKTKKYNLTVVEKKEQPKKVTVTAAEKQVIIEEKKPIEVKKIEIPLSDPIYNNGKIYTKVKTLGTPWKSNR